MLRGRGKEPSPRVATGVANWRGPGSRVLVVAGEMTQQATRMPRAGELSLLPGTHAVGGENSLLMLVL